MDQFYKDLVEKIRDAAEKDIQKIMGETGGEKIYVAALVTDSFIIQSRPCTLAVRRSKGLCASAEYGVRIISVYPALPPCQISQIPLT